MSLLLEYGLCRFYLSYLWWIFSKHQNSCKNKHILWILYTLMWKIVISQMLMINNLQTCLGKYIFLMFSSKYSHIHAKYCKWLHLTPFVFLWYWVLPYFRCDFRKFSEYTHFRWFKWKLQKYLVVCRSLINFSNEVWKIFLLFRMNQYKYALIYR